MGEKFYPDRFLKQVMPKSFYTQGLVSKNFTLQKGAISAINRARLATGRPIDKTVYDVLLQYKAKYKDLIAAEDFGKAQAFEAALNGENLLRQRIEQAVIFDKIQDLKAKHKGEFYRWMPSSAENPDPQHGLLYGKIFRVGEGDKEGNMPGERYGCQCGIEWLGEEEVLMYSSQEKAFLGHVSQNITIKTDALYENAIKHNFQNNNLTVNFGKLPSKTVRKIEKQTGESLKGFVFKMDGESVFHALSGHGEYKEIESGQVVIDKKRLRLIPHIVWKFDRVSLENKKNGMRRLKFQKKIGHHFTEIVTIGKKKKHLLFKTFYGKQ